MSSPQQYRPPQADIYTVLLAIALAAVIIGCVFLYLEVADYGSPPYPEGGVTVQADCGTESLLVRSGLRRPCPEADYAACFRGSQEPFAL
ncbi:MAG: hypothetical protein GYA33_00680 [Thermogutta sp.]|nr:hypothetical protein [Thermogutta sp.]